MNNLKITNMAMNGRMPFEHKLNEKEINNLIMNGALGWMNIQEKPMVISIDIEKEGLNARGKRKKIHVSLWPTGAIIIVGITKKKEADEIYEIVFNEIKKLCPKILKNVH